MSDLEARRRAFQAVVADHWEHTLKTGPEVASLLGERRWNAALTDLSEEGIAADLDAQRGFLDRLRAIDPLGFPEQEALTHALLRRALVERLDGARFRPWRAPLTPVAGPHIDLPQLASLLAFASVRDYDDYLARLRALPRHFAQAMAQMRRGMAEGLMPPARLLPQVAAQVETIAGAPAAESPFARPLAVFPAAVAEVERRRLTESILEAIRDAVAPAYAELARFVRAEYAPRGRAADGVWSLPDGADRYAFDLRQHTTTDLDPDSIHRLGLAEVEAIEAQARALASRLGIADLDGVRAAARDPGLAAGTRQRLIDLYREYTAQMERELPRLFGRLPKAALIIESVESFREADAAAAEYNQGAPDGSRPGVVKVNTRNAATLPVITAESTAYHEGWPGHHLQIALAQQLADLPPFRQQPAYTAYVEGWALYAERLGKEVGFYQEPWSEMGRLQDEMLRAIRLVVDTGLHARRWTRDQALDFFRAHSALPEPEIAAETDRYIVWPGQALGYKLGQLAILDLRAVAEQALGPRFDLRAFHDAVLGSADLPLDVLRARLQAWIASQRAPGMPAAPPP